MSSDERELRAALENTQAALRKEREVASKLGQTTAELESRLREAERRERDLQAELAALPRPVLAKPEVISVSVPAAPEPPEVPMPWWYWLGFFGWLPLCVAFSLLKDIWDTPWWETPPPIDVALPYAVVGGLMVGLAIFGAMRAFRK